VLFGSIKTTLKLDSKNRGLLRDHLTNPPTRLRQSLNELLDQANTQLAAKRYKRLVVIVDNLDRIVSTKAPNSERTYAERLFLDSKSLLTGMDCHVVYTLPPSISYSTRASDLRPQRIPMVPICHRNGNVNQEGLASLADLVRKRIAFARLKVSDVFPDEDVMTLMCGASGGYERQLLRLLQQALSAQKGLPLQREAVEKAIRKERDFLVQGLLNQQERWVRLREIAATRPYGFQPSDHDLLDGQYILEYYDGSSYWYDINPVLRLAPAFQP
jgi:hypothetical protein